MLIQIFTKYANYNQRVVRFGFYNLYRNLSLNATSRRLNIGKFLNESSVVSKHFYGSVDFDYSLRTNRRIAVNRDEYFRVCEKIIKNDSAEISLKELACLPAATSEFNEHDYFVKEILSSWWKQTETKLLKFSSKNLAAIILNLQNIDYYTNGRVVSTIKWTAVEKLACEFYRDIENVEIFHCQSVLRKLTNFTDADPTLKLSPLLQKIISKSISSIFLGHIYVDKIELEDNIGSILYSLAKLGFQLPPASLPNVYALCVAKFLSKNDKDKDSGANLTECSLIGWALYTLNINPGQYFWKHYYTAIKTKLISENPENKDRFLVTVLKTALLVGVAFSENQYKFIFQPFWTDQMQRLVNALTKHEIDSILNLCIEKYDGDLRDIENVISPEILARMLQYTDSFRVDKNANVVRRTGIAMATEKKSLRLVSTKYLAFCQQVQNSTTDNPSSVPAADLCGLPQAAIECRDVKNFVNSLFSKWCSEMARNFSGVPGYQLVHAMAPLTRMNKMRKGEIVELLKTNHPNFIEHMAECILDSVQEPAFTHNTLSMLLDALVQLQVKPGIGISPSLQYMLTYGFDTFFDPKYFSQRNFASRLYEIVGHVMFYASECNLPKPSDNCLKIVVEHCAKNFRLDVHQSLDYHQKVVQCFTDLSPAIYALVTWRADADRYYSDFWRQCFDSCRIHFVQLNANNSSWERRLKNNLLTNCLLAVLTFDKEVEFNDSLKQVWQAETFASLKHRYPLSIEKIESILNTAKTMGKLETLDTLTSKPILDKFTDMVAQKR